LGSTENKVLGSVVIQLYTGECTKSVDRAYGRRGEEGALAPVMGQL